MTSYLLFKEGIQNALCSIFIICLFPNCSETSDSPKIPSDTCSIKISTEITGRISNNLMGYNVVYPQEKDRIWSDGDVAGMLRDIRASLIRYPGGTVTSFYHWNALTGNGWADRLDPENKLADCAPSEFMDVDEYMALIRKTGAEPLMGINISSAFRWGKVDEGVAEALALMKYCKDHDFKVKYWYLDNEPYQPDSNGGAKTPEQYAALINIFAPAMKMYDPDIEIIANWRAGFVNKMAEYEKLLGLAGRNIDVIDVHWYWAWKQPDQMTRWLATSPMGLWTAKTYISEIADFRKMVAGLGFPGIRLASFEWNVGPSNTTDGYLTGQQCALIQSEMLMQFIIGGLDMAVFWPLHWPDKNFGARGLVNSDDLSARPNLILFKFIGQMQGNDLLKTEIYGSEPQTLHLAGINEAKDTLRIYFLNKKTSGIQVSVNSSLLNELKINNISSYSLINQWRDSEFKSIQPLDETKSKIGFIAPGVSMTMVTLVR